MNQALRELYQSLILEHSAQPQNYGPLPSATHRAAIDNPLCGDTITVQLQVAANAQDPSAPSRIQVAHFERDGCAIARASASLLTTMVPGKTPAEARELAAELQRFLSSRPPPGDAEPTQTPSFPTLGKLIALQGLRTVPSRRRCGTLPWEALVAALSKLPE